MEGGNKSDQLNNDAMIGAKTEAPRTALSLTDSSFQQLVIIFGLVHVDADQRLPGYKTQDHDSGSLWDDSLL